jgi:hypothetical protein
MSKTILVIFLITLILFSCTLLVLLQVNKRENGGSDVNINGNLPSNENQTRNVEIADFKYTSSWGTIVGVEEVISFNLTIHNLGTKDIDNLSVAFKMYDANNSIIQAKIKFAGLNITEFGAETSIGTLYAGEVRTLQGAVMSDLGTLANAWALGPTTTIVDIKLGSVVLDEWKVNES